MTYRELINQINAMLEEGELTEEQLNDEIILHDTNTGQDIGTIDAFYSPEDTEDDMQHLALCTEV